MKSELFEMLKMGNAEDALVEMIEQNNNAKLILADYRNEKQLLEIGLITDVEFEEYKQNVLERIIRLNNEPDDEIEPEFKDKASVFLSYNQNDFSEVILIIQEFRKYDISVRIDRGNVNGGQFIDEFIINETKKNKAVILLVSKNSFKSPWVLFESTIAIYNELLNNKEVIPVKLDDAFMDDEFAHEIIKYLDAEISKKVDKARQLEDIKLNPEFLQNDLKRLTDARNQFSKILLKLRQVAVLPVDGDNMQESVYQIARQLINLPGRKRG